MDPNREHLKKVVDKHNREFSFWTWVLRVISLCIAFGAIIYYLANNDGPHDPYEESSLLEEAFFGDEPDDQNQSPEDERGEQSKSLGGESSDPEMNSQKSEEGLQNEKRPDMHIPVFRSGE